ncbi:hypothetical protein N658DRAFT_191655 [Parathielavia hyrcaniae]|uniref:Uncharacterized protein n=1 Tax=Parathielavia hyrcaniae TaxID=113614 RepID=A0AAN6T4H6_9PEZI|nr:hypothetical protein N658DRAFT_191655 [Parathielavia hyrcaniae]
MTIPCSAVRIMRNEERSAAAAAAWLIIVRGSWGQIKMALRSVGRVWTAPSFFDPKQLTPETRILGLCCCVDQLFDALDLFFCLVSPGLVAILLRVAVLGLPTASQPQH